jgi:hypothetical protein
MVDSGNPDFLAARVLRANLNSSGKCGHKDVDQGNTNCRCNTPPGFFHLHGSFLPSGSFIGGKLSDIPRPRSRRYALAVHTRSLIRGREVIKGELNSFIKNLK